MCCPVFSGQLRAQKPELRRLGGNLLVVRVKLSKKLTEVPPKTVSHLHNEILLASRLSTRKTHSQFVDVTFLQIQPLLEAQCNLQALLEPLELLGCQRADIIGQSVLWQAH